MPPVPSWRALLAWAIILAVAIANGVQQRTVEAPGDGGPDDGPDVVGLILTEIQAKYLVGAARILPGNTGPLYGQADTLLNIGTVDQRQRFIVTARELAGPGEARLQLDRLDLLLADPPVGDVELTDDQSAVQRTLHVLYPPTLPDLPEDEALVSADAAIDNVGPDDRATLVESLGWFGRAALAPEGSEEHDVILASADRVALFVIFAAMMGLGAMVVGFIGLVIVLVMMSLGRLGHALQPGIGPHAVYAETFAVWMVLFFALQAGAGYLAPPEYSLLAIIGGFFASLVALAWPRVCGVPWGAIRADVGLTFGANPAAEPLFGVAGYLMTLPILAVGLLATFILLTLEATFLVGEGPTFGPVGGPAHPVVGLLGGDDVWPKVQVMILAVVAAPIVEETMFRGVLYRHLRDASRTLAPVASIILSTGVNTFLFAAIHPQGFAAVPALMSLAIGMTLIREWRGNIVPSILIHAISNGLVMSMLLTVLSL